MTDEQAKNRKLEELKHEVKDLHPVLNALFNAMPEISNVEYTHGNREQGADFVLERRDPMFDESDFIAVIAKSGKIGPSEVSDIFRQIQESKIPKNFSGGRTKVSISSFWIVTNSKVTTSAQDLIENNFRNLHIRVIPQHRLRDLISRYYPAFWRNIPHEIAAKLDSIGTRIQELDHQMAILPVDSGPFYVHPKVVRLPLPHEKKQDWSFKRVEIDFLATCKRKHFVLLEGDYGLGKSKLLRHTISALCSPNPDDETIFIPHYCSFWKFIDEYSANPDALLEANGFTHDLFGTKLNHCIFLDSLDETKLPSDQHLAAVQRVVDNCRGRDDLRVVIASRPTAAGIKSLIKSENGHLLEILPLSFGQVIKFLEHICKNVIRQGKLIEDLKSSPIYTDLPRSPISAILLAKLLSESSDDVPSTLPELYSKYLEYAMGRWDQKKGLQTEKEYKAVSNILMDLSVYFVENSLPAISEIECLERFKTYTAERNRELNGESLFKQCMDRSDILVRIPFDGAITFKHRTYAEFLYAMSKRNHEGMLVKDEVFSSYWSTIYYFYFGLRSDCPDLVDALMDVSPNSLAERWSMVMNYPKYLLAASETRYQHIIPVLRRSVIEFVELYIDSRDGRTEFPKGRLTKMQFLSLVTPFFQVHYGFHFFQNALEEIALELELLFDDPEKRCVAAFFVAFARLGFDDPKLVDELISGDTAHLPPEMQLVLTYEANDKGCRSTPVKKFLKNVTRRLLTPETGKRCISGSETPAAILHRNIIRGQ